MADSSSDSSSDRAPPLHVMADSSDSDSSDRAPPLRAMADSSSDGNDAPDAFLAASSSGSSDGDDAPRGAAAETRMDGVDAYGRVAGEAHTAAPLEASRAARLSGLESASSLYALQQVLQRDDGAATGDALSAFARGVHGRDAAVLAVADAWAARSPHLGELCRAFRARCGPSDDAKALGCLRALAALLPRLPAAGAAAVWATVAREWGAACQKSLRRTHVALRQATLGALEVCAWSVGAPAARTLPTAGVRAKRRWCA